LVIPCFNEAGAVSRLIEEVRRHLPFVLVVDDGSSDGTTQAAARAGAEVIRHETNRGKGAALVTGLARVRVLGFAWALTMDGDGQHAPADIAKFLRAAEQSGALLVIGNRMAQPRVMPWLRRFVNRWMSRQLSRRAGRTLPDSQCGFRLINLAAWSALRLETTHFEIESEMLLAFVASGLAVEFVPIEVIYKAEQSKIHPLLDTCRWFRWWWRAGRKLRTFRSSQQALWPNLARLKQNARAEVK
jgi:glycosyltransferase involved in cell wall biosynthesis